MPCQRCENPVIENFDTMLCASCGAEDRKAERMSKKPKKVYQIPKTSPKEAKRLKTYSQLRAEHLERNPMCQIKLAGICLGKATEIHHSGKRGAKLLDSSLFMSACWDCHYHVESVLSAKERRERGFLI